LLHSLFFNLSFLFLDNYSLPILSNVHNEFPILIFVFFLPDYVFTSPWKTFQDGFLTKLKRKS